MKIVAIVNPMSGAGMDPHVAEQRVALLHDELDRRGLRCAIHLTERAGHAAELARDAAGNADLVLVWGGDGTVNEAGGALAGSRTAVGLIPAGSGNGLAGALRVPREPRAALNLALRSPGRPIDVGIIGTRRFLNIAGIGADARIAILFNRRSRGSRGRWPYIAIGLREAVRYRASEYRVQLDGMEVRGRELLIAFANGREYGMGAIIAPHAELDDGLLDAFVIDERSTVARFWDARHLARGTVERAPGVIQRRVRTAAIESPEPIEFHVDGEAGYADGRLEVSLMPKALTVRA